MDKYIEGLARAFARLSGLSHDDVLQQAWLEYLELKRRFPLNLKRSVVKRNLWSALSVYATKERSPVTVSEKTLRTHYKTGCVWQATDLDDVVLVADVTPVDDPAIRVCFGRLGEMEQAVIWLQYWLDYSREDAAKLLAVKPNTVKYKLKLAHEALQANLRGVI